jgi:hypothetical protein
MSIEVEVLSEVYNTMKQYIPQKDRQEVADNLMSVMVDVLNDLDLKEFAGNDAALSRAFKEYSSDYDDDEDYNNYED